MKKQLGIIAVMVAMVAMFAVGCGNLNAVSPAGFAQLAPTATNTPSVPTATNTPTGIPVTFYVSDSNPGTASTGGTWTISDGSVTLVQMNEVQLYSGATTVVYLTSGVTYYSVNSEAVSSVCVTCSGGPITQTLPQLMMVQQAGVSAVFSYAAYGAGICGVNCAESRIDVVPGISNTVVY